MISEKTNWLDSINWQVEFSQNAIKQKRKDLEYEWDWLDQLPSNPDKRISPYTQTWLNDNSGSIWDARVILEDDLSKLLFDMSLVLKVTSYNQFYFPRIDFENFVSVLSGDPFTVEGLPHDYLGLPLKIFKLQLSKTLQSPPLMIVSTNAHISLLNSYRQYLIKRNSICFSPSIGEVVLDCGACIGEISMLFAGLVGTKGEVHIFDPIPLHARYCKLQASLNPSLEHVLHINVMAVGDETKEVDGVKIDSDRISPGGLRIDSFAVITIDDYISRSNLERLDMIKMDIEGAEINALDGASQAISEFKPRLAISAYHKPEDIWDIPHRIKSFNNNYKLFFGHHSPIQWESVYYAV